MAFVFTFKNKTNKPKDQSINEEASKTETLINERKKELEMSI